MIKCNVYKDATFIRAHCFLDPTTGLQNGCSVLSAALWWAHGAADSGPFPTRRSRLTRVITIACCNLDRKSEERNCCKLLPYFSTGGGGGGGEMASVSLLPCLLANGGGDDRLRPTSRRRERKVHRSQINTPANIHSPSRCPNIETIIIYKASTIPRQCEHIYA